MSHKNRNIFTAICIGIAFLWFLGPAMAYDSKPVPIIDDSLETMQSAYKLGAGDKIQITVFDEPSLSKIYAVSDKGIIAMPLIGDVHVDGHTVFEIRQTITDALADGYLRNPDVAIEVSEYRPIYVMGEVRNPGSYPFVADMTVLNAIAIAGGYTYRADQDEHDILRDDNGNSLKFEDKPESTKIMPGDIIQVKERFF